MRAGKTCIKRIEVKSGQKKEIEFRLPLAPLLLYYNDFKADKYEGRTQDRNNFSLLISYGLKFHMNPFFVALEKYDTNERRKTVVYKNDLECPKIRIDFK